MEQIKEGMDNSKSILVTYQKRVIHCYDDKFRIFYLMFDKLNLSLNKHFLQWIIDKVDDLVYKLS